MTVKSVGPFEYDVLTTCPFCLGHCLSSLPTDNCVHFVAAFQDGVWDQDLCPPVFCDGFRFDRESIVGDLEMTDAIQIAKPGTKRHPEIKAYYCADPTITKSLRNE